MLKCSSLLSRDLWQTIVWCVLISLVLLPIFQVIIRDQLQLLIPNGICGVTAILVNPPEVRVKALPSSFMAILCIHTPFQMPCMHCSCFSLSPLSYGTVLINEMLIFCGWLFQ